MRADRLLRLLALLQRHRRLTAGRLAAELEVSERTVLRDMQALSSAGVPVYTERGHGGGCVLLEDFRTDASGLTPIEAQALFAWPTRDGAADLGLGGALTAALGKIAASTPSSALADAEALGGVVHADRRRWFAASEQVAHLPALREAVAARRRIRIRYAGSESTTAATRTLDPVGIVDSSGRWYLVAEHRGRAHTYRVSRVESVTILATPARPVDDRPVAAVWADLRRAFEGRTRPVDVVVTVAGRAGELRRLLAMQLPAGRSIEVDDEAAAPQVWRFAVRQLAVLAAMAVLYAPDLTVVEPVSLRVEVRAAAERTLAHYPA